MDVDDTGSQKPVPKPILPSALMYSVLFLVIISISLWKASFFLTIHLSIFSVPSTEAATVNGAVIDAPISATSPSSSLIFSSASRSTCR